tara:strand:+ start:540 stop:1208 length:669 start_codon:yes stop_codon:yes gene_type:complete
LSINIFLDSANPNTWDNFFPSGVCYGITTNPTLLKKENQPCNLVNLKRLSKIAENVGCREIHIQSWGNNEQELTLRGEEISQLGTTSMKVFVKVPITKEGIKAAKNLISQQIKITFTSCYDSKQSIIAAAVGANYLAPYLGRMKDKGIDAISEIILMNDILTNSKSCCNILVASLRESKDLIKLTRHGVNTFTINESILSELITCEDTINSAKIFEEDAKYG